MNPLKFPAALALVLIPILPLKAKQVIFSEIMYNPTGSLPEYIEVQNLTATPLDFAKWKFTNGVDYEFPGFSAAASQHMFLHAFQRILVASVDEGTLRAAYPGIPRDKPAIFTATPTPVHMEHFFIIAITVPGMATFIIVAHINKRSVIVNFSCQLINPLRIRPIPWRCIIEAGFI